MPEPHLRAGDHDRAAVAEALGRHMAAGRLTVDEYDERLTRAYAARTFGDLAELTADLPPLERSSVQRPPAPAAAGRPVPRPGCGGTWGGGRYGHSGWRAWASTAVLVTAIWLVTSFVAGQFIHFWPLWVIVPWGAFLLAGRITGNSDRGDGGSNPRMRT